MNLRRTYHPLLLLAFACQTDAEKDTADGLSTSTGTTTKRPVPPTPVPPAPAPPTRYHEHDHRNHDDHHRGHDVTFQVDGRYDSWKGEPHLGKYWLTGNFEDELAELNDWKEAGGDWSGWGADTDDDGDGIYSGTYSVPEGTWQYKITRGGYEPYYNGFDGAETLTEDDACAVLEGDAYNRKLLVSKTSRWRRSADRA